MIKKFDTWHLAKRWIHVTLCGTKIDTRSIKLEIVNFDWDVQDRTNCKACLVKEIEVAIHVVERAMMDLSIYKDRLSKLKQLHRKGY